MRPGSGGGRRPCAATVLLSVLSLSALINHLNAQTDSAETVTPPQFLFRCTSGDFVNVLYTCDGVADCDDSSDEADCSRVVGRDRMRCKTDGFFTSVWNSCDGWQDCPDAVDEDHCGEPFSCPFRTVPCRTYYDVQRCTKVERCILNNTFIGLPKVGNATEDVHDVLGQEECLDFSIEAPKRLCGKCGAGMYHCRGTNTCLPLSSLCDRSRDCLRADDEKFCKTLLSPQCSGQTNALDMRITELRCSDAMTNRTKNFIGDLWMSQRILVWNGLPRDALNKKNLKTTQYNGKYVAVLSLQNTGLSAIPQALFTYMRALRKLYLAGTVLWDIRGVITMLGRPALQYMDIERAIGDEFPFAQVWMGSLQRPNTSVRQRLDINLKYDDCCQLLALVQSNCDMLHDNINTCQDLLPRHIVNILWSVIAVASVLNLLYIISQSKHRKEDELKFMSLVTVFIANLLTLLSMLGLLFKIENTAGEYHLHDKVWRQSYSCWILSSLASLSYLLYSMALVIMMLQVITRRCFTVDRYFRIVSSRSFVCYMLIIVMIPLVPIFLPLSQTSSLKTYIMNFSPICSPFFDLINDRMTPSGKQYSVVIFVGTPVLLLCFNVVGLVLYMHDVWKKPREEPMLETDQRDKRPWAPLVCMVTGQLYGIALAILSILLYTETLVLPEKMVVNLSLFLVPSYILFSPLSFLISAIKDSKIIKNISDHILDTRKSTLRRTGGFNRRASRAYQKLSVYLEADGKVTPGEALLMARKMAFMITDFHVEGMVCDEISTDFVVIGVDLKQRVLEYDLVVTTEYPKCDVHEWRCQRDVACFGEVVKALVSSMQAAKQKRMLTKKVSFKMQLSNQLSKHSKVDDNDKKNHKTITKQ